jgi:DNA-binding transcriptional regulator YiaG
MLQSYTKDHKIGSKQATEHSSNVVVSLQSKLANTSMSFKDVLEIRTEVKFAQSQFSNWLVHLLKPMYICFRI